MRSRRGAGPWFPHKPTPRRLRRAHRPGNLPLGTNPKRQPTSATCCLMDRSAASCSTPTAARASSRSTRTTLSGATSTTCSHCAAVRRDVDRVLDHGPFPQRGGTAARVGGAPSGRRPVDSRSRPSERLHAATAPSQWLFTGHRRRPNGCRGAIAVLGPPSGVRWPTVPACAVEVVLGAAVVADDVAGLGKSLDAGGIGGPSSPGRARAMSRWARAMIRSLSRRLVRAGR